jgi:SAM-dependent methyltransferase
MHSGRHHSANGYRSAFVDQIEEGMIRLFPSLLPRTAAMPTSTDDVPGLNYHPLLGLISRLRFWIILSLLPKQRFPRLLEIGYGSGIFQPELARHCNELYGVDIHPYAPQVLRRLRQHNVNTELVRGSATALPFKDSLFDCIIAMSCLEYMEPFDHAAREIKRVLTPGGFFLFVTPGNSRIIDFGHDLLTGRSVRQGYGSRRDLLIPTLSRYLTIQEEMAVPRVGGNLLTLYRGLRLGYPDAVRRH